MHKAPEMKSSGLAPVDAGPKQDETVHVFGRNLEARIVTNDEDKTPSLSFSALTSKHQQEDDIETIRKRKFEAITGEEDEETVFQGDFKLFCWDLGSSNWVERGRGQLKLNDSTSTSNKSRLIMRVVGTHRISLNVAINPSYFRILAHSKTNIRFTDSREVWAASGSNAQQLKDLIEKRLKTPKESPAAAPQVEVSKKPAQDDEKVEAQADADADRPKAGDEKEEEEQGKGIKEASEKDTKSDEEEQEAGVATDDEKPTDGGEVQDEDDDDDCKKTKRLRSSDPEPPAGFVENQDPNRT